MPAPFHRLTITQFQLLMDRTLLRRAIDAVHVHHTWKPARADWRGEATIVAMQRYHQSLEWDDIAQHVTVDPAGGIWTGRNWNLPPASSSGANGTASAGPFMFEMVGNFDTGHDPFDGDQRTAALEVTAQVMRAFGLDPAADIKFHRDLNQQKKTCPGSGLDKVAFIRAVAALLARPKPRGAGSARGRRAAAPAASPAPAARLFDPRFLLGFEVTQAAQSTVDLSGATVPEHGAGAAEIERTARADVAAGQRARYSRDFSHLGEVTTSRGEDWRALKPHVVNLTRGELSESGEFATTPADLDAIIDAIRDRAAASPTLELMLHAHGGLVKEPDALSYARTMYQWWLSKGVYPVYFVWETGLLETIVQAISGSRGFADKLSDPAIEKIARPIGKPAWSHMKDSARRASSPSLDDGVSGGALMFARRLAAFLKEPAAANVAVHAVGHSAGAIFHSHFVPALIDAGVPKVASLSLLAPAVRTELFTQTIVPRLTAGTLVRHYLFTMDDEAERDDTVAVVYRKSLLYLVSEAFEHDEKMPILGLQRALKADTGLRTLYGLDAQGEPQSGHGTAELHYSRAEGAPENPLTRSRTHGGFDNDRATIASVLRRILGVPDATGLGTSDFPSFDSRSIAQLNLAPDVSASVGRGAPAIARSGGGGGRRLALCIGIDRYRDRPLAGCVNDARTWSRALNGLGFTVRQLLDEQATARGIADALHTLLDGAAEGDVLALQYSGHGTQLPDDNGDEGDGFDEALVPVDYHTGALFLRDDLIATALEGLPGGAALTLFMDCCHCGTNSRFAPSMRAVTTPSDRVRYLPLPPDLLRAARSMRRARGAAPAVEPSAAGVIHLAACQDDEFAWESAGQGDFTAAAVPALAAAVSRGDTNEQFLAHVRGLVTARGRQHPLMMPTAAGMAGGRLLAPLSDSVAGDRLVPGGSGPLDSDRELLRHLEAALGVLRRRIG